MLEGRGSLQEQGPRNQAASQGDPKFSRLCPSESEGPYALSMSLWSELSEGRRPELEPRPSLTPGGTEAPTDPRCSYSIIIQGEHTWGACSLTTEQPCQGF